jgi:tetratricopeptide (TPR) repeat protein
MAAQIEFFARDFAAAEQFYRNLAERNADGGGSYYGAITYRSALGRARQALGDDDGAKPILEVCLKEEEAALKHAPDNPEVAYRLAAVEASLERSEAALGHLSRAIALGWIDYRSLNLDPRFDSLRENPAFQTISNNLAAKVADMREKQKTKLNKKRNS